jgi:hypothetical protein
MIKIETERIDYETINQLKTIVQNKEFRRITERKTDANEYVAEFWKDLSNEKYNFISISFFYTQPASTLSWLRMRIYIENRVKGLEPSIKTQIDELGDIFYQKLSTIAGKENVKIEREEVGIPMFY